MALIDVGEEAPDFRLVDQSGQTHALFAYRGQPVVLYFYPKDGTSGCTKQACQMRDAMDAFNALDCVVLGVSPQGVDSKAKFADQHELNFPILADEDARVCDAYGVWQEKSMYGRTYMGVVRTTYLIAPDGAVAQRWDKVRVPEHAKQVMQELEQLA
jgi:thioredoxin-dependent peroxiredoxin